MTGGKREAINRKVREQTNETPRVVPKENSPLGDKVSKSVPKQWDPQGSSKELSFGE